jgi:hypothetical protein
MAVYPWPVTYWQAFSWEDGCLVYREVTDPTNNNNSLGYQLIPGPGVGGLIQCKAFITPYFDILPSPAGQSKQDDIFQANRLEMVYTSNIQDQDLVHVLPLAGPAQWFSVNGAPQVRERLGYAKVRIVPPACPPSGPIIYVG